MSFASPFLLLSLLAVPLALGGYLLAQRRRMRYALHFTNLEVLAAVVERSSRWRRLVPPALFLLALSLVGVAMARPRVNVSAPREQATVILVVDTSGSMRADDVRPTRIEAAQAAIERFLNRIPPKFRVAVVSFSEEPQLVAPPTTDRELVRNAVQFLFPGRGTAIGDALARGAQVGRTALTDDGGSSGSSPSRPAGGSEHAPVTMLLLSDGAQTVGRLEPLAGARLAKALGIPVYTIAFGTPGGVIEFNFGGFTRRRPVPPDPATLKQVADATGGEFFDAPSAKALNAAYDSFGSRVTRRPAKREATFAFLGGAAALLLAAGALSGLWSARLP